MKGKQGRKRYIQGQRKPANEHILTLVRGACANIENPSKMYS